jgi:hypothetical protein
MMLIPLASSSAAMPSTLSWGGQFAHPLDEIAAGHPEFVRSSRFSNISSINRAPPGA